MVLLPSFKRLLHSYQGYDPENRSPLTRWLSILLLFSLYVATNNFPISGQGSARKNLFPSYSSDRMSPHVCNQYIDTFTSSITSPGYPNGYLSNLRCAYTIRRADSRICKVLLKIRLIDFGRHHAGGPCRGDYLEFPDLSRTCVGYPSRKIVDFLRGSDLLTFNFISDGYGSGKGFDIDILQVPDSCTSTPTSAPRPAGLVCPEATCSEKENVGTEEGALSMHCRSDDDCSDQKKICCVSNCWTNYTCQDPIVKLETRNQHVQEDFQSHKDEKNKSVSLPKTSNEILEKKIRTSSAENDTDTFEIKEGNSKAKRAANKNTAKTNKKPKHSVKHVNKKIQKEKKSNSETAKKRSSVKDQKKNVKQRISKPSNKIPAKNNKKSPKHIDKTPSKRVKSNAKTAKTVKIPEKPKQKVNKKVKQTTTRAPIVLITTNPPKKATVSATNSTLKKDKNNNSENKTHFRHRPLTSNDIALEGDCDPHISNGSFKLNLDVKPLDFFDEHFQKIPNITDEDCYLSLWNNKEINLIFIGATYRTPRFKRALEDDELKEIILQKATGKKVLVHQQTNKLSEKNTTILYQEYESFNGPKSPSYNEYENKTVSYRVDESFSRTESRVRKEHESETAFYGEDESFVRMKPPLRKEHKSETAPYRADENFATTKLPLQNQHESETASYGEDESFVRIKPPLRKEHESKTVSHRANESLVRIKPLQQKEHESGTVSDQAYESFVRLKPPLRMEQSQKHQEKRQWHVKQATDQHHRENYRTAILEENASRNNDKVFQESKSEEKQWIPGIEFESFAYLKNFINTNILKIKGSHMLLLPKEFYRALSEETNTNDFLPRLIEKLFKITPDFKITLSHFVPAKYIQKNTFYDILQTYHVSTEINPLSPNVENKPYVRQRVSETCVYIPLLRKSFFEISISPQGSVQLKPLNPKSLSKEYVGDLHGRFVLQMKQPCKTMDPPVSSRRNGAEKDEALRDTKSSAIATADSDLAATSQPPINSAVQYRMVDGKHFVPERTYKQQSVGIDYFIPEEMLGKFYSKLFANTTMPQGVHKILGSKATASGIETPDQSPINNPLIPQREFKEPENQLQTVEDWNFRSLFKLKRKQAASNNEKFAGSDDADVYYEFPDGAVSDSTRGKLRLTPPDDDSFIESPVDNEHEISQQVLGFEKRESAMDNYDLDDFHGSFQLKTKGRTSNNEEVSIGKKNRLLNHVYESQDKDADDSTMKRKYQLMKPESPVNNRAKQKHFRGIFKLKSSFNTSNTQKPLNNNPFIETPKKINKLISELKQKPGPVRNTSDKNKNDFFQGMFKLKTKNEGLASEIVLAKPTDSSTQTKQFNRPLAKSIPNELLLENAAMPGSSFYMDEQVSEQEKYKPLKDNDEVANFHGIFTFKKKNTNKGSYWNPETLLGNDDLPQPSVNLDKAIAKQEKHKPLKDNDEVETFHGIFRLKQKGTNKNRLFFNSESIVGNEGFPELSVDIDKPVAEQKKHKSLEDSEEVHKLHDIVTLKKNGIKNIGEKYNIEIIDLQTDENKLNEEDKGALAKICKSLRHGSHFHASNQNKFHGLFRLKPKSRRESLYELKPFEKQTSEQNFEQEWMENFHGLYRIKTKQEQADSGNVQNTKMAETFSILEKADDDNFQNEYEVVFRLKPRKNLPDSAGKLFKLKTLAEWCKNYKRRKEPFWFS